MKKASTIEDDLQPEYDFSKLTKVGRGIFAGGRRLSAEAVKALNEGQPTGQFAGVPRSGRARKTRRRSG